MGNREQNLIGYQLIHRVNITNSLLLDSNKYLRFLDPITEEPLKVWTDVPPDKDPEYVDATIDDVKRLVNQSFDTITKELQRINGFIAGYNDDADVNVGLSQYAVQRTQFDADVNFSSATKDSVSISIESDTKQQKIIQLASLYINWIPQVVKIVQSYEISQYESSISIFQDLLNAMAFEMAGLSSYTGEPHGLNFDRLYALINDRVKTATRQWEKTPHSLETLSMKSVLDTVSEEVKKVTTLDGFKSIGEYIDSNVNRLPLVRRWWMYG